MNSDPKDKNLRLLWHKALVDASVLKGNLRLNWEKIESIDPSLYDFSKKFGFNLVSLRLVGVGLNEIPGELFTRLPSLELLSLANNNITSIPDTLVQMTNLTELSLMYNKIVRLPDRIGLLCSLLKLGINNNCLEYLPITFGALNLLQRVDLECNKLSVLPENLDNMISCKYLNLNNNQLIRLPRCLARMPSLVTLSAAHNTISYIPVDILNSKSLAVIRLSNNKITSLPEKFGDLGHSLRELSLDYNNIQKLPFSFYKLVELKVLRIEGNVHLLDPPSEVIAKGAEAVVAYCKESFLNDKQGRMRTIIRTLLGVLYQVLDYGLTDPAFFEANVKIDNDRGKDEWFALQMSYFWEELLPKLQRIWQAKLENMSSIGEKQDDDEVLNFPFTEKEIFWAFSNFHDAYGPVFRRQEANFRRCACVDENGRRKPCVPPAVGFMCRRKCVLFKMRMVRNRDKQEREWQQYKEEGIATAIKRAEFEAVKYLESAEGKLWVEDTAYAQAEEILVDQGADSAVRRRQQINERRKGNIIKKYNKQIEKLRKKRNAKVEVLQAEAERLQKDFKQANEGYMKTVLRTRIAENTKTLASLVETAQIQQLQLQCEYECEKLDAEMMREGESSDSDLDNIIGFDVDKEEEKEDLEAFDSDDDSPEAVKWRRRRDLRQQMRELRSKYSLDSGNILQSTKDNENNDNVVDDDSLLTAKMIAKMNKRSAAERILSSGADAVGAVSKAVDSAIVQTIIVPTSKTVSSTIGYVSKKTARKWTQVIDVATIRTRKAFSKLNGTFDEIQKEMKFEIYHQYIQYQVDIAKQKTIKDFKAIETVRDNMQGVGLVTTFRRWCRFTWKKVQRLRRDLRKQFKVATKSFEAAMESVNSAQAQVYCFTVVRKKYLFNLSMRKVDMWEKKTDIYTDRDYWQHVRTQLITFDKPGLQHYLPPNFMIPDPPVDLPPNISLLTSSSDEDGGSDGDWERQKRENRQRNLFNLTSPNKRSQRAVKEAKKSQKQRNLSISEDSDNDGSTIATNNFDRDETSNSIRSPFSIQSGANGPGNDELGWDILGSNNSSTVSGSQHDRQKEREQEGQKASSLVKYSSDGLSLPLQMALEKAEKYISSSAVYSQLKAKEMVISTTELSDVMDGIRDKQNAEYERAFKLIRKKRSQLNPVRHQTYMRQLNHRNRSLEQLKEEQVKAKKEDDSKHMRTIALPNGETITVDMRHVDVTNPSDEQLLKMAGGTIEMIQTGKKGVELRNILAQRAMHIKNKIHEHAVEERLVKPKSFFQREIMPLFSSTYYSDSDDSDDEDFDKKKENLRRMKEEAKEKRMKDRALKDAIISKANRKKEAIKLSALES